MPVYVIQSQVCKYVDLKFRHFIISCKYPISLLCFLFPCYEIATVCIIFLIPMKLFIIPWNVVVVYNYFTDSVKFVYYQISLHMVK